MAEQPSSSSIKPLEVKPEALSVPSSEDGAEAGKKAPVDQKVLADAGGESAENATFANTRQHVDEQQKESDAAERFAHTKKNIALINDPQRGPRFTQTNKESGHTEKPEEKAPPAATTTTALASASETDDKVTAEPVSNDDEGAKADADGDAVKTAEKPDSQTDEQGDGSTKETSKAEEKNKIEAPADPGSKAPLDASSEAEAPSKLPIDSSKTFVGPNGTYYDEAWRWMDWRCIKRSWNWPAALSFGHWFAYRRLYRSACTFTLWLMLLTAGLVNDVHVGILAGALVFSLIIAGTYGNIIYFNRFRRAVAHVTEKGEGSYDDLQQQLAEAGGIAPKAVWFMAAFIVIGAGGVLASTFFLRGGFLINIWPL